MTQEWPPAPQFPRLPPGGFDDKKVFAEYLRSIGRWIDQTRAEIAVPDSVSSTPAAHASTHEGGSDPVNHDSLDGFVAEEHIRWDQTGAEDIHVDRLPAARETTEAGITADATQTQAAAFQLNSRNNQISTCGTAGDAVKLVEAADGLIQRVRNDGAARCDVYPSLGDQINAEGTNNPYELAAGATAVFVAFSASQWFTY